MTRAADDPGDGARVARIDSYAVTGRPPRPELQELVGLAARIAEVPSASITLFAGSELQVALVGPEPGNLPGGVGFRDDHDLLAPDGHVVGALRVQDPGPHVLTPDQREALKLLADRAVDVLELRRCSRLLAQARADLATLRTPPPEPADQIAIFADRVSHDLRNPLTSMSMSLQLLADQQAVAADEEATWMVARALNGAQQMDSLIENLLDSARDGGGPDPA